MRLAMGLEYDGSAYHGWQRQRNGVGVQQTVEAAVSSVADHSVELVCAGRTDKGVHAIGQVVHFDSHSQRSSRAWLLGTNSNLPDDVSAVWVQEVPADFHARFSALARTYRYVILNRLVRSGLFRRRAWWIHRPLDAKKMQAAALALLGEHDFSAFRAAGCQASTPVREIDVLEVLRQGSWLAITVRANAFLQHMVRNIVGTLVAIGAGERPPTWAGQLLGGRDRARAGVAAPAHGLTLARVDYPPHYGLGGPQLGDVMPGLLESNVS